MVAFSKLPVMLSYEDIIDKRYENGKIYFIKCKNDDELLYVGSTIKPLNIKLRDHRYHKTTTLYKIVEDWDDWYIELYENYPCKNRLFLEERETQVILSTNNINYRQTKTESDKKIYINNYNKEYYKRIDKERKNELARKLYALNREKISKRRKELYDLKKQNV